MPIAHNLLGLKPAEEEEERKKPPSMLQKCRASCTKKKQHGKADQDGIEVLPVAINAPRGEQKDGKANMAATL